MSKHFVNHPLGFIVSKKGLPLYYQAQTLMADRITPEQRHYTMSRIRSVNSKPEIRLRHALWRLGFRYRINDKKLPGKPDIVLPKYHTIVFVHGCFWHGHKGCPTSHIPETNTDFWTAKIARNQERDQEVWRQLEAKGWAVIIVWECQLKKSVLEETIRRVKEEIHLNGRQYQKAKEERKASRLAYQQERKALREKESVLRAELQDVFPK